MIREITGYNIYVRFRVPEMIYARQNVTNNQDDEACFFKFIHD
jgi:hypothetical protein